MPGMDTEPPEPPQDQQHETAQESEANDENALDNPTINAGQLFSTRRPRDVVGGFSSGLQSLLKGVFIGIAVIIAAPIVGAVTQGLKGFLKGFFGGLLGGAIFLVTGSILFVTQLIRGLFSTPSAIFNALRGRHWDHINRLWVTWNPASALSLPIEAQQQAASDKPDSDPAAAGLDSDNFFQILGVSENVSPDDLRRQYYRLAREHHPDKNPDDPLAHARFQKLSRAYQVLSNPEAREAYCQFGDKGVQGPDDISPSLIFTLLFGSDLFTDYVGELLLATSARLGSEINSVAMQRFQMLRTCTLIAKLVDRLQPLAALSEEGFRAAMAGEAARLIRASYGDVLLRAVGTSYLSAAEQASGGLRGLRARARAGLRSFGQQISMLRLAVSVLSAKEDLEHMQAEERQTPAAADADHGGAGAGPSVVRPASKDAHDPSEQTHLLSSRAECAKSGGTMPSSTPGPEGPGDETPVCDGPGERPTACSEEQAPEGDPAGQDSEPSDARAHARDAFEQNALPVFMEAMWAANAIDIEKTLHTVCRVAVRGGSHGLPPTTAPERRLRTAALRVIGEEFVRAAASVQVRSADEQMRENMARAMEAASRRTWGQEEQV